MKRNTTFIIFQYLHHPRDFILINFGCKYVHSKLESLICMCGGYLPPNPKGSGIGNGAIANDISHPFDLSESGGLFRLGFSSSMIFSSSGG